MFNLVFYVCVLFLLVVFIFYIFRKVSFRIWSYKIAKKNYPMYNCFSCGKNLMLSQKDHFSVKPLLKLYTGVTNKRRLCLSCFEKKIGRSLVFYDLLPCPQNHLFNPYTKNIVLKHFRSIKKKKHLTPLAYIELTKSLREVLEPFEDIKEVLL